MPNTLPKVTKLGYGASQNKNRANYLRSAAEKRAKTLKNATNIKHSKVVRKTQKAARKTRKAWAEKFEVDHAATENLCGT